MLTDDDKRWLTEQLVERLDGMRVESNKRLESVRVEFSERLDAVRVEFSERLEKVETTLLTGFHKWASGATPRRFAPWMKSRVSGGPAKET